MPAAHHGCQRMKLDDDILRKSSFERILNRTIMFVRFI